MLQHVYEVDGRRIHNENDLNMQEVGLRESLSASVVPVHQLLTQLTG